MCHRWGDRTHVAYTRSHSYSVVSQAGALLLRPTEREEAQAGAAGTCPALLIPGMVKAEAGMANIVTCPSCWLSCWVGESPYLFCYSSFSLPQAFAFLLGRAWGNTMTVFPFWSVQILGAVLSPEFGCLPSLCHAEERDFAGMGSFLPYDAVSFPGPLMTGQPCTPRGLPCPNRTYLSLSKQKS